jgi:Maintenance of mitochondrial structure and function
VDINTQQVRRGCSSPTAAHSLNQASGATHKMITCSCQHSTDCCVRVTLLQSFEALNQRAVAVVVDPIQSVKGKVVIDAFRLINPQTMMLGHEPRQTTSNVGHLHKPSIQALIHGLNRHYYSIAINYRKNELEERMLMNLQKKTWSHGLNLRCPPPQKKRKRPVHTKKDETWRWSNLVNSQWCAESGGSVSQGFRRAWQGEREAGEAAGGSVRKIRQGGHRGAGECDCCPTNGCSDQQMQLFCLVRATMSAMPVINAEAGKAEAFDCP